MADAKICFVIMPFSTPLGSGYSAEHFTEVYEDLFVPAIEASSFATAESAGLLPSGVDRAIYPSFPSPRASEKLFFTGPETSRPAPDATRRPLIDAIDFAEQLRVALIEDARRHGIEV